MKESTGLVICSACNGSGKKCGNYCRKCRGEGSLDCIENIVGKNNHYFKPGVYTKEVDLSEIIPAKQISSGIVLG